MMLGMMLALVDICVQQRNGRKSLKNVQRLKKDFSYNKILKDLKKEFCCNGTVVQDPELGLFIQLQGENSEEISYQDSWICNTWVVQSIIPNFQLQILQALRRCIKSIIWAKEVELDDYTPVQFSHALAKAGQLYPWVKIIL
ncbi:hypothetical protein L2E82_10969 [Cichorium intybus]|uniref:Uncharacterized protein n=1 Tax=Cichorium intybus TaxID=13427 RepID=A0ACB9GCQ0_CICIN|nr:hypothetical protein L2E82_10969 [Cichorium intybus]